ncbi:MAG: RDD family protein [Caldilineaceae bacterium]|nr:RDD family protein [Caldilineaceae bacterium]
MDTFLIAGWRPRVKAFLYDYLLIVLYISLLALLSISPPGERLAGFFTSPASADLAAFVLLVLPVLLYFALLEGGSSGATWDKRRAGVRVIRTDGGRLGYSRSLLRETVRFLPWQMAHTAVYRYAFAPDYIAWRAPALNGASLALAAYYLIDLVRRADHRPLYDRMAGSMVVTRR